MVAWSRIVDPYDRNRELLDLTKPSSEVEWLCTYLLDLCSANNEFGKERCDGFMKRTFN